VLGGKNFRTVSGYSSYLANVAYGGAACEQNVNPLVVEPNNTVVDQSTMPLTFLPNHVRQEGINRVDRSVFQVRYYRRSVKIFLSPLALWKYSRMLVDEHAGLQWFRYFNSMTQCATVNCWSLQRVGALRRSIATRCWRYAHGIR
jgi:hypothetical protein